VVRLCSVLCGDSILTFVTSAKSWPLIESGTFLKRKNSHSPHCTFDMSSANRSTLSAETFAAIDAARSK
jgi:hypothetical protein